MRGRQRGVSLGIEAALALLAGVGSFALSTIVVTVARPRVSVIVVGVLYVLAVLAVTHFWGIAYGVPVGVAGVVALDWYYIPPTHSSNVPDAENASALVAYLVSAVLLGQLGAHARRRAEASEAARGAIADEQASLRRVATLVAGQPSPAEVFAAVTEEVARLLPTDVTSMLRYEGERTAVVVASHSEAGTHIPIGTRLTLEGDSIVAMVHRSGRPARMDHFADATGPVPPFLREIGVRSAAGSPIVVDGRLWGVMVTASVHEQELPEGVETRIGEFTELVATALANAESREAVGRLAEEQAALWRVATLVARGTRPQEVFSAVANEVGRLLSVDAANVIRYESDDTVTLAASAGDRIPVGSRWRLGETTLAPIVLETGRPARVDNYAQVTGQLAEDIREQGIRSSVAAPIIVEGRVWGQMVIASSQQQPLPPDTEARLALFTDLLATAIANTEARTEVARLADEQAALLRVATLVAEGAAPSEVFETVTREVGILCGADLARLERYESGDSVVGVAAWSRGDVTGPAVGIRFSLEGASIAAMVRESSRPMRVDSFAGAHGPIAKEAQGLGIRSSVGCPIVLEGRLWGIIAASSISATPFPPKTESQIAEFTELVATAIANTEARTEVAASRARIVAAADEERRRVVRDLHDGAQQRLVHTILVVAQAQKAIQEDPGAASEFMADALAQAEAATEELRALAHGLLPEVLTHGGLRAAVKSLARRTPVPVDVAVSVDRLPASVEAIAYFFVAEALTNVAKHARATVATVLARVEDGTLRIQVRDDGVGGAQSDGSGLVGLADRLAALDGQLRVESPAGGGTLVTADMPISG